MAKKKESGKYLIPFNKDGDQLHYAERMRITSSDEENDDRTNWVENFTFHDTLKIGEMMRGRSAAYFILESTTTNKRYTMFMKEMIELIKNTILDHGEVEGTWTFVKRGLNYGIMLISES